MMLATKLAWSQTVSLWRAGALRVLVFALVLAVAAITAVSFFTQRIETALNQQGSLLIGGDLAVVADHPIPQALIERAVTQQIQTTRTYEFPSMVMYGEVSQLVEIKAIEANFPLRGHLTIAQFGTDVGRAVQSAPKSGEVWIEPRLATLLDIKVGDQLDVGERSLTVAAILLREPSRGGNMFSFAPRVMMNASDLASTQLIQYGSRVKYQLLLASAPEQINDYAAQVKPKLNRGERIDDVRNARPEIKTALDKAQQFLGLSAMVSVVLAMVAMLLSSLPYIRQSLNTFALMRCFGAQQNTVLQILTIQTLIIALLSALLGAALGFVAQLGLAQLAGTLFVETLPSTSLTPLLIGICASIGMMVAVVLPHAWQMRNLSAMNILRLDTLMQPLSAQAKYLPAALVMVLMIFWQAQDAKIALSTIVAMLALSLVVLGFVYVLTFLVERFLKVTPKTQVLASVRLGIQGLKRRLGLSTVQMIGFSMGLMVIMLLTIIRGDLIRNWQASLPEGAPNRFVINIQPEQIAQVGQFFTAHHIKDAAIFPMVRARLVSKNKQLIKTAEWQDERAKRLAEREFNLSWAEQMQSDNKLVAGRWWSSRDDGKPLISLEEGLAQSLNIKLGDELQFDVAGTPLILTVSSLRKVEWDTMRANFFAVTPPGVLEQFTASHISSFHLPIGAEQALNQLIKQYPNLTVIDIAALMQQVRGIMHRMSQAVEYVFAFSLLVGIAVLYAALVATREDRIREATLMRVFGASRQQVSTAYIAEFACIGVIAALVASIAANVLAYYISVRVLNIPFQFNFSVMLIGTIVAAVIIPTAAWLGLRGFLNIPPRQLLNSI
nr:FtsX-like permease family protein [uncultured Methylotenera sp.]